MLLWAEDSDVPLDTARQAVQRVHAKHSQQVSQHASASHVSLPEPLQALMVAAVKELTGDASFQPFNGDSTHNSSSAPPQPVMDRLLKRYEFDVQMPISLIHGPSVTLLPFLAAFSHSWAS